MEHRDDRRDWTEPEMHALTDSESRADDPDVAIRNGFITIVPT